VYGKEVTAVSAALTGAAKGTDTAAIVRAETADIIRLTNLFISHSSIEFF
jgi:hypothetical protein